MKQLRLLQLAHGESISLFAKVVVINALIIGATFSIVAVVDYKTLPDPSLYKTEEMYPISDVTTVGDTAFWISKRVDVEYLTNNSGETVGERLTLHYFLTTFDGDTVKNTYLFSNTWGENYYFSASDLEFNGSSSFRFTLIPTQQSLLVFVYEKNYLMLPKNTTRDYDTNLNGFPTIITIKASILEFRLDDVSLVNTYVLGEIPTYWSYRSYNQTHALILVPKANQTDIYISDFISNLENLTVNSPPSPEKLINLTKYIADLTPFSVDMSEVEVQLVDRLGRIHVTGRGLDTNDVEGNRSGRNRPDYALVDPRSNQTTYWQLLPSNGLRKTMNFIDLGEKVLLVFQYFPLTGYYLNSTLYDQSPDFNEEGYYKWIRRSVTQLVIFDPANPTDENYIQFNQNVSQTPLHTITYPRLFNVTELPYTTIDSGILTIDAVDYTVGNTSVVRIGISMHKTSRGFAPDLNGCISTYGRTLVRQDVRITDGKMYFDNPEISVDTVSRDDCEDQANTNQDGWNIQTFYGLFKLSEGSSNIYALTGATRYLRFGDPIYYTTYIYRF